MEEGEGNYAGDYSGQQFLGGDNLRVRDLEEKQRILKDRLLLIGQNLVEFKEKTTEENLEIKKEIEVLKKGVERLLVFLETASKEFSRYAKKEDVEILAKQIRMFQPTE